MKKRITVFLLITMVLCILAGCGGKKTTYTVNYDTDGGSFIEAFVVDEDHPKAVRPADPTKEGYLFKEWQLNGAPYDFSQNVTSDITLKAIWEKAEEIYSCTVLIGTDRKTVQWRASEILELEDPTPPENMTFVGWRIDGILSALAAAKNGSFIEAVFADKLIPCTAIRTDYNSYYTVEGYGTWKLDVYLTPANTTDTLSFKSDDENVVTVDDHGNITAKNPGKTKIHISCGDARHTIDFETRPKKVEVSSLKVSPASLEIYMNNFAQLTVTVEPENATDKTLKYTSSDTSIVTVDNKGLVMGTRPGNATITITASNGVKASIPVCIQGETVLFEMANGQTLKAASGEKIPYKATHIACYNSNITRQDVTRYVEFHTAYPSALDIDGYGNVYAKGEVYESVDAQVYFSYTDGSSFNVVSQPFTIHIVK